MNYRLYDIAERTTTLTKYTPEERFWAKVHKTETCWLWIAHLRHNGYGEFGLDGKLIRAHHFLVGKPPNGYVWDHLCRIRACIRPSHLELVTEAENRRRGIKGILTTHCPQGHPYDVANTGPQIDKRWGTIQRACRACKREYQRKYRLARLAI